VATGILAGVLAALTLSVSLTLAILLLGVIGFMALVANRGNAAVLFVLTAGLPWLIVFGDVLPRTAATFAAGATALVALLILAPRARGTLASSILRLGFALFFTPILASFLRSGSGTQLVQNDQLIQGAKYVVFPLMVLVVTEATNTGPVPTLRALALWSGASAVTVNLFLGLTGIANTSYYGSGEVLGLGSEHSLALLAGLVTAAALAGRITLSTGMAAAVGATATVATGVRSTLPGLAAVGLSRMIAAGARLRTIAAVGLAVGAIFISGAAGVIEARFHEAAQRGEFSSLSNFGSGRGAIYSAALDVWWHSSPVDVFAGTGLGTIPQISEERLGTPVGGHSDLLQVGVELGIVGLAGFLMIWGVLIARAESKLPLLVLGSFALLNGTLEYGPPIVIGLLLTFSPWRSQEAMAPSETGALVPPIRPAASTSRV
jgi:hypothetical protein